MKKLLNEFSDKFRRWWIKSDSRIIFHMKLWLAWSNFYQKIERKFMKTDTGAIRTWIEDRRDFSATKSAYNDPKMAWKLYCERNKLYHYKTDKWYMLYDVISAPERVLVRKGLDCDDFSLLAYNYFGKFVNFNNKVYEFDGFYSVIWNNTKGHSIAIWKNPLKEDDLFMVSNKDATEISNIRRAWNIKEYEGIRCLVRYGIKNNKLIFKNIE